MYIENKIEAIARDALVRSRDYPAWRPVVYSCTYTFIDNSKYSMYMFIWTKGAFKYLNGFVSTINTTICHPAMDVYISWREFVRNATLGEKYLLTLLCMYAASYIVL